MNYRDANSRVWPPYVAAVNNNYILPLSDLNHEVELDSHGKLLVLGVSKLWFPRSSTNRVTG
jgi:hypothetical protein